MWCHQSGARCVKGNFWKMYLYYLTNLHLFISWICFIDHAIVQVVNYQRHTIAAQVQSQLWPCGICGGQSNIREYSPAPPPFWAHWFSPTSYHPTYATFSHTWSRMGAVGHLQLMQQEILPCSASIIHKDCCLAFCSFLKEKCGQIRKWGLLFTILCLNIVFHYLLTHSQSWALLEEPPIMQPLKNFPAFYGTQRLNIVFTRALYWSLSWAI
jgi:hypothetical protein